MQLYTALRLGASVRKVLNFRNMLLYTEYVMDDMEFPRELPSVQEDMFQVTQAEQVHTHRQYGQCFIVGNLTFFFDLFFCL